MVGRVCCTVIWDRGRYLGIQFDIGEYAMMHIGYLDIIVVYYYKI